MKLLLDQGLPRSAVDLLAEAGIESEHVGQLGMSAASDDQILDAAVDCESIVVSLDSDFHSILAARGTAAPSVIRIRIEGLTAEPLVELLLKFLFDIESELEAGAVVSVTEHQVRIRSLPIGRKAR